MPRNRIPWWKFPRKPDKTEVTGVDMGTLIWDNGQLYAKIGGSIDDPKSKPYFIVTATMEYGEGDGFYLGSQHIATDGQRWTRVYTIYYTKYGSYSTCSGGGLPNEVIIRQAITEYLNGRRDWT